MRASHSPLIAHIRLASPAAAGISEHGAVLARERWWWACTRPMLHRSACIELTTRQPVRGPMHPHARCPLPCAVAPIAMPLTVASAWRAMGPHAVPRPTADMLPARVPGGASGKSRRAGQASHAQEPMKGILPPGLSRKCYCPRRRVRGAQAPAPHLRTARVVRPQQLAPQRQSVLRHRLSDQARAAGAACSPQQVGPPLPRRTDVMARSAKSALQVIGQPRPCAGARAMLTAGHCAARRAKRGLRWLANTGQTALQAELHNRPAGLHHPSSPCSARDDRSSAGGQAPHAQRRARRMPSGARAKGRGAGAVATARRSPRPPPRRPGAHCCAAAAAGGAAARRRSAL